MRKRLLIVMAAGLSASCGVVGPPIPPENVGVAVTIELQKQRDRDARQPEAPSTGEGAALDPATQDQELDLPPLRPVGTR